MLAIAETTFLGQFLNIGKSRLDARIGIPKPKTAHARHIDDKATARQLDHLTAHRSVPALAVTLADSRSLLNLRSHQQVDEARLAHAASPNENNYLTRADERSNGLNRRRVMCGNDQGRNIRTGKLPDLLEYGGNLLLPFRKVGFGEDHRYVNARLVSKHQLALQTAHVHFAQGLGNNNTAEIRSENLRNRTFGRIFAHKRARTFMDALDNGLVVTLGEQNIHQVPHHCTDFLAFDESSRVLASYIIAIFKTDEGETAV